MDPTTSRQSTAVDQLATALAKAQAEFQAAPKGAVNPHLGTRYADLSAIIQASRGPLAANGLSVVQRVATAYAPDLSSGTVTVSTTLLHASGQWVANGDLSLPVLPAQRKGGDREKQVTPQSVAAVITYARRFDWASLVGVAVGDDDAHGVPQPQTERRGPARAGRPPGDNVARLAFGPMKGTPVTELTDEALDATLALAEAKLAEAEQQTDPATGEVPGWVPSVHAQVAMLEAEKGRRSAV
jgi:hypothetical protein